jgi:hypothetical protein
LENATFHRENGDGKNDQKGGELGGGRRVLKNKE